MTPEPMSEDEIIKCIVDAGCVGTVKMTFESGPYDITRASINSDKLVRAIIAARDAQWREMLGEPVAEVHEVDLYADHAGPVEAMAFLPVGTFLYAIKDKP